MHISPGKARKSTNWTSEYKDKGKQTGLGLAGNIIFQPVRTIPNDHR